MCSHLVANSAPGGSLESAVVVVRYTTECYNEDDDDAYDSKVIFPISTSIPQSLPTIKISLPNFEKTLPLPEVPFSEGG